MGRNRLRWRGRRGGGKCKSGKSLGAGRSSSPLAHEPGPRQDPETEKEFAAGRFTSLSPGEQCIVLLMRALVSRPPLVLLDEGWSGMDDSVISAGWRSLTEGGGVREQAVVVITH